jgi:DNA-binding response OmpR family regulator
MPLMKRTAELNGHRILIVEDSYYLASDLAHAVEEAGGDVIGPCPSEALAFSAMDMVAPTCGILDINLGAGLSFEVAYALAGRGVPFLFVTGHDPSVIPSAFAGAPHLLKPVDLRQVVSTVASLPTEAKRALA